MNNYSCKIVLVTGLSVILFGLIHPVTYAQSLEGVDPQIQRGIELLMDDKQESDSDSLLI